MLIAAIPVVLALGDVLAAGSKAPAFTPEKFLKGTEVKALEPGKVHVIEFWATWCGPCVAAMPHLSQLQKDNPDIAVIGVAGFERAGDAEANEKKVRDFIASRGDAMGIAIALDTDGSMAREWMTAAKRNSIPTSFVVGKDGRVAYVGSPNKQLDDAVKLAKAAPGRAGAAAPAGEDVKVEVTEEPTDEKGTSKSTSMSTSTSSSTRDGVTETETITTETTVEVKDGTRRTTVKTTTVRSNQPEGSRPGGNGAPSGKP